MRSCGRFYGCWGGNTKITTFDGGHAECAVIIRYVDITGGVDCDTFWPLELSISSRKEVSVAIKLLDTAISAVCYIDVSGSINRNTRGI